jgi:hypothetical protein
MSGPQQETVNQQENDPQQQHMQNARPIVPPAVTRREKSAPTLSASSPPTSPRVPVSMRSSKTSAASVASGSSGISRNPFCRPISPPAVKRRETRQQAKKKQHQEQSQQKQQNDLAKTTPPTSELPDTTGDSNYDASLANTAMAMRRCRSSPNNTGELKRNRVAELLQMADNDEYDNNDNELGGGNGTSTATTPMPTARRTSPRPLIMSINTGMGRPITTTATAPKTPVATTPRRSRVAIPLPPAEPSVSSQQTASSKMKKTWASLKKYRKYTN